MPTPQDRNGRALSVGDIVRIVGMPDLSGMSAAAIAESKPLFEHLVGTRKRIRGFNAYGLAHFIFSIESGAARGYHGVWLEPHLLHLPQPRVRR